MKTRIVATLGPASTDYEKMKAMARHGVRIFRLNFSHADAAFFAPTIKMIREIENELDIIYEPICLEEYIKLFDEYKNNSK